MPDGASDKEIDVINLDDEESVEVEGDDDEVEDEVTYIKIDYLLGSQFRGHGYMGGFKYRYGFIFEI